MAIQNENKVRVVIECSLEERACIKMLAACKHETISEYFLSKVKEDLASKPKIPNKTTLEAHQDVLDGKSISYDSMEDFWDDMGVKKHVKS